VTDSVTWRTNKAGVNIPLMVMADPFNNFAELSETNNKASTTFTVNSDTRPNLTIFYKDILITPNPVHSGGNMNVSALVKNEGSSSAADINVSFYRVVHGADSLLLGAQTIPSLSPGSSARVAVDWTNIPESGEKIIYIQVDPANMVPEIREDDNDAFTTVNILTLPDLAIAAGSITFSPAAPKEGDLVTMTVAIQNSGEQAASNVIVRLSESGVVLGEQAISSLAGNSTASISLPYDTTSKKGVHTITAEVDPDNALNEQSEENNSASRAFGVQDANLWLTEQYISPNGDGVKDSTQFFFRLETSQTVLIVVVNSKGETVRTYSNPELENTTGGTITWDGLDDTGMMLTTGSTRCGSWAQIARPLGHGRHDRQQPLSFGRGNRHEVPVEQ